MCFVPVTPELILVLIGDTNSIEFGPRNILIDHNDTGNAEQVSGNLYDLCGRHISVINMLGLQDIDTIPLNKGIHVFLLLIPHGLHERLYSSGLQWLETVFGKESLAYVMIVVTHESHEKCESALTDLKSKHRFDEKRFHTCTRTMVHKVEIIGLLEKIDVMVTENKSCCYSRPTCDENEDQNKHLGLTSHEEERVASSEFQQIHRCEHFHLIMSHSYKPNPKNIGVLCKM